MKPHCRLLRSTQHSMSRIVIYVSLCRIVVHILDRRSLLRDRIIFHKSPFSRLLLCSNSLFVSVSGVISLSPNIPEPFFPFVHSLSAKMGLVTLIALAPVVLVAYAVTKFIYYTFIYRYYVSPFRHLPHPKVCAILSTDKSSRKLILTVLGWRSHPWSSEKVPL